MSGLKKRLNELEAATNPAGRVRWMFCWKSQDPLEAQRKWEARLAAKGHPLQPGDEVRCIVWHDDGQDKADDWSLLDALSHPSETRAGQ